MNAEIIKDFLAGLGFQQNADRSLDTLGSTITRNITSLGRAADATALSMGRFIGRLANGLDRYSTPPLGGAFSAGAATPATGAATSLTGLASLTGTLAGLNRALQAPSVQAAILLTPLATALAPTLSCARGAGQSDAANQTGTGSWRAVINKAGTSLSGLLDMFEARSPQSDTGSAAANRQLAGYSRYQAINGEPNNAMDTGNDHGVGSGVQTVLFNASAIAGTNAPGNDNVAAARNSASNLAMGSIPAGDKPAIVANNSQNTTGYSTRIAADFSAMRNSLINTVKGWVRTLDWPAPGRKSAKKINPGSAKSATGSEAVGDNASNAEITPMPSVTSTEMKQNSDLNAYVTSLQTGNQTESVPQPAAGRQGGIASFQRLLNGVSTTLRRLTDFPQAGRKMTGSIEERLNNARSGDGRQATFSSAMSGKGGQIILNIAEPGGALGYLAKGFNVNPTALLNIAGPRLSVSLTAGMGQWEHSRIPYANEPMGRTGAAVGATTLNQTTNITVNGAVAPNETANSIADRQISVNATLTQLLSPKAR